MNLENYYICQTTKPQTPWKYKQFWGLRPDPSCLEKKRDVRKIKAEVLKQYIMSLKKVACKDRANKNGMQ